MESQAQKLAGISRNGARHEISGFRIWRYHGGLCRELWNGSSDRLPKREFGSGSSG